MRAKREIRVGDLVNDIRSGMTDSDLRRKYRLSSRGLQSAFKKLAESAAVRPFWTQHMSYPEEYWTVIENMRQLPRLRPHFTIPVLDGTDQKNRGTLRDVTEQGIGTTGLSTRLNEQKTLVIPSDELGEYGSFSFDVQCRWSDLLPGGEWIAGFEITNISRGCLNELRCLIRVYTS